MAAAHCVALSANESLSAWMKAFPTRRAGAAFRPMVIANVTRPQARGGSCAGLPRIGEEELLALDLVLGNGFLALGRDHPVDESLPGIPLYARMLVRVHQHPAVLIEQALVAFDQDRKIAAILE